MSQHAHDYQKYIGRRFPTPSPFALFRVLHQIRWGRLLLLHRKAWHIDGCATRCLAHIRLWPNVLAHMQASPNQPAPLLILSHRECWDLQLATPADQPQYRASTNRICLEIPDVQYQNNYANLVQNPLILGLLFWKT